MDIKPIETEYKGCRFRSRLEARWALFFDILDVKWEYEPKCFDLGHGILYLPDFWLPNLKLWIEIKPLGGASEEAIKKIEALSYLGEWVTSLFCGLPNSWGSCFFFAYDETDGSAGEYSIDGEPIEWGWNDKFGVTLRIDDYDNRVLRDRLIMPRVFPSAPFLWFSCKTYPAGPQKIIYYAQKTSMLFHFGR